MLKRKKNALRQDNCGYLFILPFYIFFALFIAMPVLINVFLSFTDFNLKSMDIIGISNYVSMLSDPILGRSILNTLVYAIFTVGVTMVIGMLLSLAFTFNSILLVNAKYYRAAFYLPYITSMVAISMVWLWMYEPSMGVVNQLMKMLKLPQRNWLFDASTALGSIIIMAIWKNAGYFMTLYIAGLSSIPRYLYEAATVDGATAVQRFFKITLPMLRPVTFFILITGTINAFNVFDQVNVMTNGGPMNSTTTIVHQIYWRAFNEYKMGYASAIAVLLFVIVLAFTLINFRYGNQGQDLDIG